MRITDINIGKEYITNGLKPIIMSKLNRCVVIAGKNGSGKSRLLSQIIDILKLQPKRSDVHNAHSQIKVCEENISQAQENINNYKRQLLTQPHTKQLCDGQISIYTRNISMLIEQIEQSRNLINWPLIKTDDYYDNYTTISFVPKNLNFSDSSSIGWSDLNNSAKKASKIGIDEMNSYTFAYIQVLQNRRFNATHPESTVSADEKDKAIKEYDHLKVIIRAFLGCEIDRDLDGQAKLFGFRLALSKLSDGQKVILQYCIALHAQGASLDDHILIMDEPENHLHPSILIELIENIRKFNQKGQIWIATHSIPLLSYFDPQDIWYMEDGLISKYGKVSEKVLESLLGGEEQIEKLKDFISLPAIYAVNHFAYEALFPPPVLNTDSTDSQTRQVHKEIAKYIQPDGKIKILDYGAGKGRILNCTEESKDTFIEQVEYYAFDESPINREECIYSISELYENPEERYFTNEKDLKSKHDEHSFDIIIMCNVLHEIDPIDWLGIFGSNGFITKLLKKPGIMLLVEDHQLPHGEKAYLGGFIVLDTPEIKKLFNISSEDENFGFDDFRGDGRLKAHRIPQPYLENITRETRKEALEELIINAKREIIKLRQSESKSYRNGRLTGFWIHQLCNAILASSKL
jgi:ABC-type cobalamin/Fe3+-siderophores transport system ATPase subunit